MTKTDSTFPAFSLRIVDFAAQFFLRCKSSFHEKRHSSQVWQWRDLPKPITILSRRTATNGIASFCIDHRWRQMAFFVFVMMGKAPASMRTKFISLLYKQIDSMLPCICPVIDHRGRQNVVRTSALFCAYHILTSSVIYYWTDAQQHGIYLLNEEFPMILHLYIISLKILRFLPLFCCSTSASSPNLRIVWMSQLKTSLHVPISFETVYMREKRALFKYPVAAAESWQIVQ